MLLSLIAIVVMLGILSVLIIVHEFGHFSFAKLFGFQTPVFGFGLPFGPHRVIGHKWGTEFRVYACLLGGFVAIPELGDETNAQEETFGIPLKPFRKFPIWQRAIVAFAGVGFNILFAWLLVFGMLACLGEPNQPVVVTRLPAENPIAANAGVKVNDRIYSLDSTAIDTPEDIVHYLSGRPATKIVLHINRPIGTVDYHTATNAQFQKVDLTMTTNEHGKVGMELTPRGPVHFHKLHTDPLTMGAMASDRLLRVTQSMLDALGMMFQGIFSGPPPKTVHHAAPHLGFEDLHGPLMVIAIGAEIAKQQDWTQLINFTVMISLDLAIMNLLPWPALDGFHLAAMAVEAVRGKPMEERAHGEIVKWGFISLLLLMAVIMVNDVRSLVTGEFSLKLKGDQPAIEQNKGANPPPDQAAPPAARAPATGSPAATAPASTAPASTAAASTAAASTTPATAPAAPSAASQPSK